MRNLKHVLIFGLVLMIFAGCSKEEIQPDPLNATDSALKNAKVRKGPDHFVPFKASFELVAGFNGFGPVYPIDFHSDWPTFNFPPGAMHILITGEGKATHLGKTGLEIEQWWSRQHASPPPAETGYWSYGQGSTTFIAANGDELWATYWGWADHRNDDDGTEIETHGTFIGGTGRFEDAEGTFLWVGVFKKEFMPTPATPIGTEFGAGSVTVTGTIKY